MSSTLTIILIVLSSIAILAILYMIIAFRRLAIVAKKLDYLIEDLTYKSEIMTPVVDALVKLSDFTDLFETILEQKYNHFTNLVNPNKESIHKVVKNLGDKEV